VSQGLAVLRNLLDHLPARLSEMPAAMVVRKPAPDRWSPQEELGHLLDSAANNHQRIVRIQYEDAPAMPGYDGERWVALHAYQEREWNGLIDICMDAYLHHCGFCPGYAAIRLRRLSAPHGAPFTSYRRRRRRLTIVVTSLAGTLETLARRQASGIDKKTDFACGSRHAPAQSR